MIGVVVVGKKLNGVIQRMMRKRRSDLKMKNKCKVLVAVLLLLTILLCGCDYDSGGSYQDVASTLMLADKLQEAQPTPTDIEYSLERYNLMRRLY